MAIPANLCNTTVYLTNATTKRFLFSDGSKVAGGEGGWTRSPKMQAADANYYNRAQFTILPRGDNYLIQNNETKRLVFCVGPTMSGERGDEGGWKIGSGYEAPICKGSDANYYNRGLWVAKKVGEHYMFTNLFSGRLLFSDGSIIKVRGAERGWKAASGCEAPDIKTTDANYYGRALWSVTLTQPVLPKPTEGVLPDSLLNTTVYLTNASTHRFLFSDGKPLEGAPGSEGGWINSPKMQATDANYYNRAQFIITKLGDHYMIRNQSTKRLVFSAGAPVDGKPGDEGGWKAGSGFEAPMCVGADANYYNGALWEARKVGECYIFKNVLTQRLLFSDGTVISKRGAEGGWKEGSGFEAPDIKGADANYYNRAYWGVTTYQPELVKVVEVKPITEPEEVEPTPEPEPEPTEETTEPPQPIEEEVLAPQEVKLRITRNPMKGSGSPAPFTITIGDSGTTTEIWGLVHGETRVITCETTTGKLTPVKLEATGTENSWNGNLIESVEVLEGGTWVKLGPENVWVEGSEPAKDDSVLKGYPNLGKVGIFNRA